MSDIRSASDAARVLWQQFDVIDGAKQGVNAVAEQAKADALMDAIKDHLDGKISREDLEAVAGDQRFSAEQREAARYLLDDRAALDRLDGADQGGKTDGIVGRPGAMEFIGQHRVDLPYEVVAAADAADVLGTGARSGQTDDYDGRLAAFAEKMQSLPEADRAALMKEVLRQDEGAPKSWLEPSRLDDLKDGRISADGHRAVSEAFAATPQGVQKFIEDTVNKDVKAYQDHASELNWLVANEGPAMSPQQLQKAVEDFSKGKGADWTEKLQKHQDTAAGHGREILQRLGSKELQSLSAQEKQELMEVMGQDNPQAQTAIALALREPLEIPQKTLNQAMGFFEGAALAGAGAQTATALSQAYLAHTQARIQAVDPANPQSLRDAQTSIETLRDSNYARMLGLPADKFNTLIDSLGQMVPAEGQTISAADMETRAAAFSSAAGELDRSVANSAPMQGLRVLGLTAGAIGLYQAGSELFTQFDPKNAMKALTDMVGLTAGVSEALVAGSALAPESSAATKLANPGLVKVLGAAGMVFAAIDLYKVASEGDHTMTALTATGLAGGALATFGTALGAGAWAGPVGVALGVVAGVGVIGVNQWRRVDDSNEHMNSTSREFLQHAGLKENVAGALVDQSAEGHSPVPFLFEFAAHREMSPEQTVEWLNGLSKSELESIRDRAHEALDKAGGDLGKFEAKSDQGTLDFLQSYARMKDGGNPMVGDNGSHFHVAQESREVVAGTWDEFAALLQAKGRPLPTPG